MTGMSSGLREFRLVAGKMFSVTAATVFLAISQWVIMVLIARIDGADQLGAYSLAQAWINPALFLCWLGIRQQLIMNPGDNVANLLSLRLIAPVVAYTVVSVAVMMIAPAEGVFWIVVLFATIKYIEGLFDFEYGILQGTQRDTLVTLSSALRAFTITSLFVIAYYATGSLLTAMAANTLCGMALFLALHWKHLRTHLAASAGSYELSARTQWHLLLELAPLSLGAFVGQLTSSVPRMIIESRIGVEALGHFSAVMALVVIGAIAAASLGQAVLPALARAYEGHDGKRFLLYALLPVTFVMVCGVIGFVLFLYIGTYLLVLIYGPTFSDGGNLLAIGALVAGPSYSAILANVWLVALRAYRASFVVQVLSLAVTSYLTDQLATTSGSAGALIAIGAAGLVQIGLCAIYVLYRWR